LLQTKNSFSKPIIYHLILVNELSEAEIFYNNYIIKFIEGCNNQMTHLKQFDVIQNIKERYAVLFGELLEKFIPIDEFIEKENSSILTSEIV
jgi:hypothetical protein